MIRKAALIAATLVATSTGAFAKTYNISLDGYCDTLKIKVSKGIVIGSSNAPSGCDDSYVVGTVAKVSSSIAPGGSVLITAGDLGVEPAQFVDYLNLSTGVFNLYGTTDGKTLFSLPGTFTILDAAKVPPVKTGLPKISARLFK